MQGNETTTLNGGIGILNLVIHDAISVLLSASSRQQALQLTKAGLTHPQTDARLTSTVGCLFWRMCIGLSDTSSGAYEAYT